MPSKPKGFKKMSAVFGNGKNTNSRNSRDVWKYLGVKEKYARWVKRRIAQNGAEENVDFSIIGGVVKDTAKKGDFEGIDYIVTDDFAKHLGMMEKTEKGKEVRNYFLYMEKLARYLLEKHILDCEIKTIKVLERKDKQLQEAKKAVKTARLSFLTTDLNGDTSLKKYLSKRHIGLSESAAWDILVKKDYIIDVYVDVKKRILIDFTIGRQPSGKAPRFNHNELDLIFADYIAPTLF